jgi:hypothetical protein
LQQNRVCRRGKPVRYYKRYHCAGVTETAKEQPQDIHGLPGRFACNAPDGKKKKRGDNAPASDYKRRMPCRKFKEQAACAP